MPLPFHHRLVASILSLGPVPHHVALIMDGNRRFAKHRNNSQVIEGHKAGFDKLLQCLEWCSSFSIKQVTVFAFSIENYKRSQSEVSDLMQLALDKFEYMLDKSNIIHSYRVKVRICGCRKLMPPHLIKVIEQVEEITANYNKCILNICMSYTASMEVTESIDNIASAVKEQILHIDDIDERLIESQLYTAVHEHSYTSDNSTSEIHNHNSQPLIRSYTQSIVSTPIDILIRTSGETRLSDFLSSQISSDSTLLCFVNVMWPEFSFHDFGRVLMKYQKHYQFLINQRQHMKQLRIDDNKRIQQQRLRSFQQNKLSKQQFLKPKSLQEEHNDIIIKKYNNDNNIAIENDLQQMQRERQQRIDNFLFHHNK